MPRVQLSILFYLQYFIAGLLVADVFVLDLERIPSSALWDALGILSLAGIFWFTHEAWWAHLALPFLIGLLSIAALRSYVLRRIFANPLVAVIGGMCYSVYLLHLIFIAALFKITRHAVLAHATFPANFAIQVLLTAVPAVLLCAIFFVLVERPCMDPAWPSKLWRGITGRSGAAAEVLDSNGTS
jgi:peptidoglycan/LPS O-acetylase OafA/YrhL